MLVVPPVCLATARDARAIAELSRDSIEYGLGWRYTQGRILRAIQSRTTNVAVIHERGCVSAFGIMDYGETTAHLVLLGVQPTQRRRGLGARVLRWLEACALTAGLEKICVEARADNPVAVFFYQQQGYGIRSRTTGYYGDVVDAVCLEKRLRLAERPPLL